MDIDRADETTGFKPIVGTLPEHRNCRVYLTVSQGLWLDLRKGGQREREGERANVVKEFT